MGIPEINLTESRRCFMAKVAFGLCLTTVPFYLFMLTMGIYIEVAVQDNIRLIEGNRDALPAFMVILSFFGLIANLLGSRICWVVHDSKRRDAWKKYLKIFVILSLVICICVFVSSMLCFASIVSLRKLFGKGILRSMKSYSTDMPKKHIIDLLQINYECCGSTGYTDWFNINFVSKKYISDDYMTKEEQETYTKHKDNVPFSCCNPAVLRPCINTLVHSKHFRYEYHKDLTVYRNGCGEALMKTYKMVLNASGGVIVFLALFEFAITAGTRFLQTGFESLNDEEDSIGFLLPFGGKIGKAEEKDKNIETQKLLEDDVHIPGTENEYEELPPPLMTTLASLQSLPPVGSIDNLSVDESFDEVLYEEPDEVLYEEPVNEEFPPPPADLIPPRQSVRYVNEM